MKQPGYKSYGSIGHLPGSRLEHNHAKYGTGKVAGKDMCVQIGSSNICTKKSRKGDLVIVQEKLDGANVGISRQNSELFSMTRSGKPTISSKYEHHRLFAQWIIENAHLFDFLQEGERLCGEWLALAHGTRYKLPHMPFVAFDIILDATRTKSKEDPAGCRVPRLTHAQFSERCSHLVTPHVIHIGDACSIEKALSLLDPKHHGALDPIEGCVWRVEREGKVDFLAKYVRPDKKDGCYLPEIVGMEPIWNWRP